MNSQVKPLMSSVSAEAITASCPSLKLVQSQSSLFTQVAPPDTATATSLVFAGTDELLQQALKQNALGYIIPEKLLPQVQTAIDKSKSLWTTTNVHM